MEQEQNQPPLKNLIAALCALQGALVAPKKDTKAYNYKYATLDGIWEICRPLLCANGLAFVQLPSAEGNKVTITGTLYHVSGESITTVLSMTAKDSLPQSIGSAITYLRRYQMCPILGIAPEDDDGALASGVAQPKPAQKGFSHGKPITDHLAEESERELGRAQEKAQNEPEPDNQDLGTFRGVVTGAKVDKVGPLKPDGLPQWTLYTIRTEGHGILKSFSDSVFQVAELVKKTREEVFIHTAPSKNGPTIERIEVNR